MLQVLRAFEIYCGRLLDPFDFSAQSSGQVVSVSGPSQVPSPQHLLVLVSVQQLVPVEHFCSVSVPVSVSLPSHNKSLVLSVASKLHFQRANFAASCRDEFLSGFNVRHSVGTPLLYSEHTHQLHDDEHKTDTKNRIFS